MPENMPVKKHPWADLPPPRCIERPPYAEQAANLDTPLFVLVDLLENAAADVRELAAKHPKVPRSAVQFLIDAGSSADLRMLQKPLKEPDEETLRRLQRGGPWPQALWLVHLFRLSADHAKLELARAARTVKEVLAQQPHVPLAILEQLAGDSYSSVHKLVLQHPEAKRICAAYQRVGAAYPPLYKRSLEGAADVSFLLELSTGNRWQRRIAAAHPHFPILKLTAFAHDESHMVRFEVAGNPSTPAELLETFVDDIWLPVRICVTRHPRVTSTVLACLAEDDAAEVRESVACSLYTPAASLAHLAIDRNKAVCVAALNNPRTPQSTLKGIKANKSVAYELRQLALQTLQTPTVLPALRGTNDCDTSVLLSKGNLSTFKLRIDQSQLEQLSKLIIAPPILAPALLRTVEKVDVRSHLDQIAVAAVLQVEQALGHHPEEMSHNNQGFDIEVGSADHQRLYVVEVKGKGIAQREIQISRSQIEYSLQHPEQFRLAVVRSNGEAALEIFYVSQPFANATLPLDPAILSVSFDLTRLLQRGQRIWKLA